MRILVSGAAGFLGSHFVDRTLQEGHQVVGVDNFSTGQPTNLAHLQPEDNFEFLECDLVRGIDLGGPLDGIVHMASPASPVDYLEMPLQTLRVGSTGTRQMLELAHRKKARLLFTSTSEVYGDPQVHPQPESYWGNVNPIGPRSVYDESKRFSEAMVMAYHRKYGLEVRIARIFNTYGPRMRSDDGRVVSNFLAQALQEQPLTIYGDGQQTRSFCYVDDLIEGLWQLWSSDHMYPVNLGNPAELSILELAETIQEVLGVDRPLEYKPLPEDDPQVRQPDISKARDLLGWEPEISPREGLRRTGEYFHRLQKKGRLAAARVLT